MNRRKFLATAPLVALAGCATSGDSATQTTTKPEGQSGTISGSSPGEEPIVLARTGAPSREPDATHEIGGDGDGDGYSAVTLTVGYYSNERVLTVDGGMAGDGCSDGVQTETVGIDDRAFVGVAVYDTGSYEDGQSRVCPDVIPRYTVDVAVSVPSWIERVKLTAREERLLSLPELSRVESS